MPYYLLLANVIFIVSCIACFSLNKRKALKCFSKFIISISGKNDLAVAKVAVFALYALVAILVIDVSVLLSDLIFNSFISVVQNNESKPEASTLVGSLGTFGDFFGGTANPILTFLTFICLLITISVQRKELELSRIEFKKTAENLELQEIQARIFKLIDIIKEAPRAANLDLKIRYENDVIEILDKDRGAKSFIGNNNIVSGFNTIEIFPFFLSSIYSPASGEDTYNSKLISDIGNSLSIYDHCYGVYIRMVVNIISNIDAIKVFEDDGENKLLKCRLMESFKSSLSTAELALIMLATLFLMKKEENHPTENLVKYSGLVDIIKKFSFFDSLNLTLKDIGNQRKFIVINGGVPIISGFGSLLDIDDGRVVGLGAFGSSQTISNTQVEFALRSQFGDCFT